MHNIFGHSSKPTIKKSPIENLTVDSLLLKVKSIGLPKAKQQPVEALLKAYHMAASYHYQMRCLECAALSDELDFHRACHALQKSYVEATIELFKTRYERLVTELREEAGEPLRALVAKFWLMREDTSEESLRDFLGLFKQHAAQFDAVLGIVNAAAEQEESASSMSAILVQLEENVQRLGSEWVSKANKLNANMAQIGEIAAQTDRLLVDITNIDGSAAAAADN